MSRSLIGLTLLVLWACSAAAPTHTPSPSATAVPTATTAPTAVPTDAPTAAPTATAMPTPTSAPTDAPTATASATTERSPGPAAWQLEKIGDLDYDLLTLAVDGDGFAHFVGADRDGLVYWTNRAGQWASERIGTPADGEERDRNPSLVVGPDGRPLVAFERSSCFELGCGNARIFFTQQTESGWSEPFLVATGLTPSLAIGPAGDFGVAYVALGFADDVVCDQETPIGYAVPAAAGWDAVEAATHGDNPKLAMTLGGGARILIDDYCAFLGDAGLWVASAADVDSAFVVEEIPGTVGGSAGYAIALDRGLDTHVLYGHYNANDEFESAYVRETDGTWSDPDEPIADRTAQWMALDDQGVVHLFTQDRDGSWYAENSGGAFAAESVMQERSDTFAQGALAVDPAGRPHVIFESGGNRAKQLWYGVLAPT